MPFLVFALAGGAIPLPLTVLQILAFDVGTETLPSLALGREPAEPGMMQRPPRKRSQGVIRGPMLVRAWLFSVCWCAPSPWAASFCCSARAGTRAIRPASTPLHHAYLQATTMTFLGMIVGQIGTAFAVRTQRASLRSVGVFSNRYLVWAVPSSCWSLLRSSCCPLCQAVLGTAPPHVRIPAVTARLPVHRVGRRRDPALAATPASPRADRLRCAAGAPQGSSQCQLKAARWHRTPTPTARGPLVQPTPAASECAWWFCRSPALGRRWGSARLKDTGPRSPCWISLIDPCWSVHSRHGESSLNRRRRGPVQPPRRCGRCRFELSRRPVRRRRSRLRNGGNAVAVLKSPPHSP